MGEKFTKDLKLFCNGQPLGNIGELRLNNTNSDDKPETYTTESVTITVKISKFKMWRIRKRLKKILKKSKKDFAECTVTLKN